MRKDFDRITHILKENKQYLISLFVFVLLFLFFCTKMSFLYPVNDWSDTNVYFNIGKAMLDGKVLYSEVFDHKGPLIFFIYAIGASICSSGYIGLFVILLFLWILFAWAIFFTCSLFLNKLCAFSITLLTIFFCLHYMGMGGSAEEFILIFEGISLLLFIRYFYSESSYHNPRIMFVHGILVSAVFFIKLSIILFWFFPLLAIFGILLYRKAYKNFATNLFAFMIGVAVILLPILLYFVYHQSLEEAYHVYIELNKQYSSSDEYKYLFTNGCSKLYTNIRENFTLSLLYLIGVFYFPFQFLKNKAGALSITLSGIGLIVMIFYNLTFHFYYPLILLIYTSLGLICIFHFFRNIINDSPNLRYQIGLSIIVLTMSISQVNFFGMGTEELMRTSTPSSPEFKFKHYLVEVDHSSLLNLSFGSGNALFTTTNKTPTVKYFFSPNIYYNMYPNIRDEQTEYIENKSVDFIISSSEGFNYHYFETLEALHNNYTIIDSTKWIGATYYLYKKK